MGKKSDDKDAPLFKKVGGLFSKDDERNVMSAIIRMSTSDQILIVDFLGWLFMPRNPQNGESSLLIQHIESFFYRNEFYTYLSGMRSESIHIGDKSLKINRGGVTTERTQKIYANTGNDKARLLEQIVDHLRTELQKNGGDKEAAHRAVYNFLRNSPVPCHRVGETDWTGWLSKSLEMSREQAEKITSMLTPFGQSLLTTIDRKADHIRERRVRDQATKQERSPLTKLRDFLNLRTAFHRIMGLLRL